MANLKQLVSAKAENDSRWREQQVAERENAVALQNAGITQITTDPEVYARYLEMQGDNPSYSAGNIALVMVGLPQASIFGTQDRWKSLNRSIVPEEKGKGVKIFAKSSMGRGYTLADAYDVTQTQGRDLKRLTLQNDTKDMETAISTVLNYAVVPVVIDEELPVAAYYDQTNMEIAINPDCPDNEALAAIAAEVAHSRFHNKGANPGYDRAECDLDTQSVSYILCRRFGVERPQPDASRVPELYGNWDVEDRKQALDSIQDMSKQMGRSIDRNIDKDKQRGRAPAYRPAR